MRRILLIALAVILVELIVISLGMPKTVYI